MFCQTRCKLGRVRKTRSSKFVVSFSSRRISIHCTRSQPDGQASTKSMDSRDEASAQVSQGGVVVAELQLAYSVDSVPTTAVVPGTAASPLAPSHRHDSDHGGVTMTVPVVADTVQCADPAHATVLQISETVASRAIAVISGQFSLTAARVSHATSFSLRTRNLGSMIETLKNTCFTLRTTLIYQGIIYCIYKKRRIDFS